MPKKITLRLDESTHRRLKVKAASEGKTLQGVAVGLLEKWLEEPAASGPKMREKVATGA